MRRRSWLYAASGCRRSHHFVLPWLGVSRDLRSGQSGLELLKMAANTVVDDAIADADHEPADELGFLGGDDPDGTPPPLTQGPGDLGLGRVVERHRAGDNGPDLAARALHDGPILVNHRSEELDAAPAEEQPDQISGGVTQLGEQRHG